MAHTTIRKIIYETCEALWNKLRHQHLSQPTEDSLKRISHELYEKWNFPNSVGSIDRKYIRIRCPTGSRKKFYSLVLQAVADANYKFTCIDIGGDCEQNDGGTFMASMLYNNLEKKTLKLPKSTKLPNSTVILPHVLLGDAACPLKPYLMRPYAKRYLSNEEEIFNYRLSRARRSIQYAFGLMSSKWRLLNNCIETHPDKANLIVKCICLLHNIVIEKDGASKACLSHLESSNYQSSINIRARANNRYSRRSDYIREAFQVYFNSDEGAIPQQYLQGG